MEKSKFNIGEVVYLNSSRIIKMTVQSVEGTSVTCLYFNTDRQFHSEIFHQDMLTKVERKTQRVNIH